MQANVGLKEPFFHKKWSNWSNLMLITTHQNLTEVAKVVKGDIINALVPYEVMS